MNEEVFAKIIDKKPVTVSRKLKEEIMDFGRETRTFNEVYGKGGLAEDDELDALIPESVRKLFESIVGPSQDDKRKRLREETINDRKNKLLESFEKDVYMRYLHLVSDTGNNKMACEEVGDEFGIDPSEVSDIVDEWERDFPEEDEI